MGVAQGSVGVWGEHAMEARRRSEVYSGVARFVNASRYDVHDWESVSVLFSLRWPRARRGCVVVTGVQAWRPPLSLEMIVSCLSSLFYQKLAEFMDFAYEVPKRGKML